MRYLSNHLIDFDEICIVMMHISRSDPISDQKYDNLKIWKYKIVDRSMSNFDHIFHGGVDLASRPKREIEKVVKVKIWNKILTIKQQISNINGKNFPVYNQV